MGLRAMCGEVGTFECNGRQVGGFIDWQTQIFLKGGSGRLVANAQKFWMNKEVTGDLEAVFYVYEGGKMVMVSRNAADVNLPEHELKKIINTPIRMNLSGQYQL